MHLTPKEIDKLMLLSLGAIAARRKEKGLKLNYPEAVAYISSAALEGAREGKTLEQVMTDSTKVLTKNDVMEGVADMISLIQVEAVFTGLVQGFTGDEDAPTYYPKRIQAIGNAKNLGFKIIDEASAEADLQKKNQKTK